MSEADLNGSNYYVTSNSNSIILTFDNISSDLSAKLGPRTYNPGWVVYFICVFGGGRAWRR